MLRQPAHRPNAARDYKRLGLGGYSLSLGTSSAQRPHTDGAPVAAGVVAVWARATSTCNLQSFVAKEWRRLMIHYSDSDDSLTFSNLGFHNATNIAT